MKLTKEQVQAALASGLHLTDPDGDTAIPMKFAAGALILNKLLTAIASGEVSLNAAMQTGKPPPPPPPPVPETADAGSDDEGIPMPPDDETESDD